MFGRKLRTPVPGLRDEPSWLKGQLKIREHELEEKIRAKMYFDTRHKVKELVPFNVGRRVIVKNSGAAAIVVERVGDRTYKVFDGAKTIIRSGPDLLPDE